MTDFDNRCAKLAENTAQNTVAGRYAGFTVGINGTPAQDYSVSYGFDDAGRLGTVNDGETFTYGYFANSSLVQTLTSPLHVATRTYEANRDVLASISNDLPAGKTYQHAGGVTNGPIQISAYGYVVNSLGQRTDLTRQGVAFASSHYDHVGYNATGEVVATNRFSGTTPGQGTAQTTWDQGYVFDGLGNRTASTASVGAGNITYTLDSLNEYDWVSVPGVNNSFAPVYDDDRNLLQDGWTNQTWDAEPRRLAGADYGYDGNGNVTQLLGTSGTHVILGAHYEYDAFGQITAAPNPWAYWTNIAWSNPFRFSTKFLSAWNRRGYEYNIAWHNMDYYWLRWYDYGYRWYDPMKGRWTSTDPIGEVGGENLYGFVGNDGIASIDYVGYEEIHPPAGFPVRPGETPCVRCHSTPSGWGGLDPSDGLSYFEGADCYLNEFGGSVLIGFESVDPGWKLRDMIDPCEYKTQGTHTIDKPRVTETLYQPRLGNGGPGSVLIRLTGTLEVWYEGANWDSGEEGVMHWSFEGAFTADKEMFDFEPHDPPRTFPLEPITTIIRNCIPGKPFQMEFTGSRKVTKSGVCCKTDYSSDRGW